MPDTSCEYCAGLIPLEWERCPHCARPGLYPNVKAAADSSEREALDLRHRQAMAAATARGAEEKVREYEERVASSKAVIARPLRDLDRLVTSDRELYPTFYGLTQAEVRVPLGDRWDRLRRLADEALFPGYKEHIRFGALSLDGVGLTDFGNCSLTLRDDMIAHRASVFEDNSASVMESHGYKPPPGLRALWGERSRLCAAKQADEIHAGTAAAEFPRLLLREGSPEAESRFVEVHIWGPLSIRSVERVVLTDGGRKQRRAFLLELRDRLAKFGISLESKE